MTTIALRNGIMAGDRLIVTGSIIDGCTTKVHRRPDGALIGYAGPLSLCTAIRDWFLTGAIEERPKFGDSDDSAEALVAYPDGRVELHDREGCFDIEAEFYAIGSGASIALGAMAAGCGAAEAVEMAAEYDTMTGGGVNTVVLGALPVCAVK